jgi:Tol biopolymer transport system component
VPGVTKFGWRVYVRDRQAGKTELVSIGATGSEANDRSFAPSISANGRFTAFESQATNLVPGVTPPGGIYVRDRQNGTTEFVSAGGSPAISADGRLVAFASAADNLVPGDTNGHADVFVAERE